MTVERFIRFVGKNGVTSYGELPSSAIDGKLEGSTVDVLSGDPFAGLSKTGEQTTIKKVHRILLSLSLSLCTLTNGKSCFVPSNQHRSSCALVSIMHTMQKKQTCVFLLSSQERCIDESGLTEVAFGALVPSRFHQTGRRYGWSIRRHSYPP